MNTGIEINFLIFACDHFFHKQKCNIQNFQKQFFLDSKCVICFFNSLIMEYEWNQ